MARQRLHFAIACLCAVIALTSAYAALLEHLHREPSEQSIILYNVVFAFLLACAVEADRRLRAVRMPYEYSAFLFIVWPVAVPFYLFQTRRWRGVALFVGVLLLFELPSLVSAVVYFCEAASVA